MQVLLTEKGGDIMSTILNACKVTKGLIKRSKELQKNMNVALIWEWKMARKLAEDWKFWRNTLHALKLYLWAKITRWETLLYDKGGTLSGVQRQIAALIDVEGNEDALGRFGIRADEWENINDVALNLLDKSKRREYLEKYISLFDFPGRGKIQTAIDSKSEQDLRSLQLQLVPYYKWHIDGKIGPLTLSAVEDYISKNKVSKHVGESEEDFASRKTECNDQPITTWGDWEWRKEVKNNGELTAVITTDHAYFLDWDFTYSIDSESSKVTMVDTRNNKYSLTPASGDSGDFDPTDMENSYKVKLNTIKTNLPTQAE